MTDRATSLFQGLDDGSIGPEHLHNLQTEFMDLLGHVDRLGAQDRLEQLGNLSTRLEKRSQLTWFTPFAERLVGEHMEDFEQELRLALNPERCAEYKLAPPADKSSNWHEPTASDIVEVQVLGYIHELPNLVLDDPDIAISQGRVLAASIVQCPVAQQLTLMAQLRTAVNSVAEMYPPIGELLDAMPNPQALSEDMPS